MSLFPLENWIGFGAADFVAILLTCVLLAAAYWRRSLLAKFAGRTTACMIALAALPVVLRLLLLPHHPVPTPDVYDEFGHLFVADTLRHLRFANPAHPMHRFFETFFILQEPTYSSIYPPGQGMMLALGRAIFGYPWAGVLLSTSALCALVYWMLRAWTSPGWSLTGGAIAVMTFGPLCPWMNNYWGGSLAAAAGCLVIGSLPRFPKFAMWLGVGLACVVLIRPYEAVFLFVAVLVYLRGSLFRREVLAAIPPLAMAGAILLFQNHAVTGQWTKLPYGLSQEQYGVPAVLTFQKSAVPHRELTPQQEMEYRAQLAFLDGRETILSYLLRLQ